MKIKFRPNWMIAGLVLSMLTAVGYMGLYGVFRNRAAQETPQNVLETQDMADILVEQSYMFYYDLCRMQSHEPLSFSQVYIEPKPDCQWVLERIAEDRDEDVGADMTEAPEESQATDEAAPYMQNDRDAVNSYLLYLDKEYCVNLEERFSSQIAYNFNYICEDTETGVTLSNVGEEGILPEEQYFYLTLVYDEYGNCEVEDVLLGSNASLMRKYASVAARAICLEDDEHYKNYEQDTRNHDFSDYFLLKRPENCRISYSISYAEWKNYESGAAQIFVNGEVRDIGVPSGMDYNVWKIRDITIVIFFWLGILAFFMPLTVKTMGERNASEQPENGAPDRHPAARVLRLPMEAFLAVAYLGLACGISLCIRLAVVTLSGTAAKQLARQFAILTPASAKIRILIYGINFVLLTLCFLADWYIGVYLREVRRLGLRAYIREKSLIYRIYPYGRARLRKLFEELSHFDLTKKSNKLIVKVVVINGVILCLISSLWLGGWGFAIVYSLLLYLFLRKYISNLQKKYALLLKATNGIAEGNLNVQIQEDLGVFEPFKPQVYRIQEGFRRAVDEEVKSQRMKAELITNVSHDLKTPLTAIITYVNLLKEDSVTEEQRREYLETLERKSLRLKALIEDLFEVSKANSQNVSLNIMDVDIMNLVKQVTFEMGDKLAERKLDLRMTFPEERVILPLDSQRTYRVFENLFGNIAKYAMPCTRVYVNGFCVEDTVVITLKNITAEEIFVKPDELTERFVRGDASRNTEGSGLGLAIAKSFTELQGGTLDVAIDGDLFKVTTVWKR